MLREAFEWLRWASPATVLYRLAICGEQSEAIAELARVAESLELRSALLLRSARVIYFAAFADNEAEMAGPAHEIDSVATAMASTHGGHATLLQAPLKAKLAIAGVRSDKIDQGLQLRVKKAFDPSGVFVPGRVVGGI
jgi:FAD/FMN-containing dehydrogenase